MKLSIITAVRNGAVTIADCIGSIRSQTYACEHIVIDGCSSDATLDIVRQSSPGSLLISEPDSGIYDAMNKGIGMATGEVIGILNADDFYASPKVLEKVARTFADPTVDACYGDLEYVDSGNTGKVVRYWRSGLYSMQKFSNGWMPPHPTFFARRSLYERHGTFNLTLGSAADYELMLRFLVKHKANTSYVPEVLVRMRTGGVSNASFANRVRANQMDQMAWKVNGLKPSPWMFLSKPLQKIPQYLRKS